MIGAEEDEPGLHSLWVDRFTPRHYVELLSDDVRVTVRRFCLSSCFSQALKFPLSAGFIFRNVAHFSISFVYSPVSPLRVEEREGSP